MSRKERINRELDMLIKMIIFLMTITGAIIAYSYVNKDLLALIATGIPLSILWYFYVWIKKDLQELEDED